METNSQNEIMAALAAIPGLVKAIQTAQENNEKMFQILSENVRKRIDVDISDDELHRVVNSIISEISKTRCALPSTQDLSKEIAAAIAADFKAETKKAAIDAIKDVDIKNHVTLSILPTYEAEKYADEVLVKRTNMMAIICAISLFYSIITSVAFFNSKLYVGAKFEEAYTSGKITREEAKWIKDNTTIIARIPNCSVREAKELLEIIENGIKKREVPNKKQK